MLNQAARILQPIWKDRDQLQGRSPQVPSETKELWTGWVSRRRVEKPSEFFESFLPEIFNRRAQDITPVVFPLRGPVVRSTKNNGALCSITCCEIKPKSAAISGHAARGVFSAENEHKTAMKSRVTELQIF
jgi:hypothetical protein